MKHATLWIAIALGAAIACSPKKDTTPPDGGKACTEEAKICPDGSSVGRTGPDCEFAACPEGEPAKSDGDAPAEDAPAEDPPAADGG